MIERWLAAGVDVSGAAVSGWLPDASLLTWGLAAWAILVIAYAFRRSAGEAPQDPIRVSGPSLERESATAGDGGSGRN